MSVDIDYTWVLQNKRFFSNLFRGKYVAVIGREVVGVGKTIQEAYENARTRCGDSRKTLYSLETPNLSSTLLGTRGVGEGGGSPLAAIASVIEDALHRSGVKITTSHIKPVQLWEKLAKAK
jgi:hypothetical protein